MTRFEAHPGYLISVHVRTQATKHTYVQIELVPRMIETGVLLVLDGCCRLVLGLSNQMSNGFLETLRQLGVDISASLFEFTY
jgi:hypothetical protein